MKNQQTRVDAFMEFTMSDEEFDALEEGKEFKTVPEVSVAEANSKKPSILRRWLCTIFN